MEGRQERESVAEDIEEVVGAEEEAEEAAEKIAAVGLDFAPKEWTEDGGELAPEDEQEEEPDAPQRARSGRAGAVAEPQGEPEMEAEAAIISQLGAEEDSSNGQNSSER
jgi:hypothetical protein